jgi:hypothetical protein
MALALKGDRSYDWMALFKEFLPRGKGLSCHAVQRIQWNHTRSRCGKIWAGGVAFSLPFSPINFSEDLFEMSRIWRYEIRMSNFLLLKMPNVKDQSSNQIQSSNMKEFGF